MPLIATRARAGLRAPVPWLAAAVYAATLVPAAEAGVLYATGFESPGSVAGPLDGQGGFAVSPTSTPDPFTVTTGDAHGGSQAVAVAGSALTGSPDFVQSTAAIALNYDAIAHGTPIVTIEAFVKLTGPSTNTGGGTGDDLASINLEALTGGYNPNTFAGYYSTYLSSDGQAYGFTTGYGPSATVTLGQFHDLKLILDFANRTSTFVVDGTTLGTVGFDPTDTSNVLADAQFTMYSYVSTGPTDPNNPVNAPVNPASYTAVIDDLTITAVPEPSSLALASAGAGLGLAAARLARRRASSAAVS